MQNIPPPPPGFTLDTPGAAPPPSNVAGSLGRPVLRKGVEPRDPLTIRKDELDIKKAERDLAKPETDGAPSGYRYVAGGGLEPIPGGPADKANAGADFKPTEFQSKSAGFLGRLARANAAWDTVPEDSRGPRGMVRQWFHDVAPDAENTLINSPERQTADQNVEDFIAASLRQESGAAIGKSEFDRQYRIFFPMPGDSPEVIAQKALARKQAIEGFKVAAGPLAEGALGNLQLGGPAPEGGDEESDKDQPGGPRLDNAPSSGPSFTPSTDGTRSVVDPKKQELGNKIAGLVSRGADRNTIMGFAVRADPSLRDDPKFNAWVNEALKFRQQQPKAKFSVDPSFYTTQVPLNAPEELLNAAARTDAGGAVAAYGAGAGNAATAGMLDEIVGATGGDADRAQQAKEFIRDEHPLASFAGEVSGAMMGARGLSRFGAARNNPLAADMALGAAYGAGESNDNRLGGAAFGGAAAYGGNRLVNYLGGLRAAAPGNAAGRELIEAADRIGVEPLPADVGGPFVRRMTGAAAQGPISAIPIVRRAQQVTAQGQAARDAAARNVGRAVEPETAGQAATQGARAFIRRTSDRGGDLYRRAEALAVDTEGNPATVTLPRAIQTLDRHITELEGIPGGAEGLDALRNLREELGGQFTVQGVRGMRTQLRDRFISQGLRGSDLERRVNQVVEAANQDIAQGLVDQGLQSASGVYQQADRYWRSRLRTIDQHLEPIIGANGERSGEEVMQALERSAKGNNQRLTGFMRALPADEQATVRATVISRLGRATNGTQNAVGDAFSLPQFLTQWNALTPGAKRTLFQGETRAALDDLARVSEGTREAQRFQNFSNTAGGIVGQAAIAGLPYAAGGLFYTAASLASQYGAGRLLASPGFARWLAGAARNQAQPRAYIDRLQRIAAQDAPIAAELTGLRQALLSGANDNGLVGSVAASPNAEGGNNERR